ncbi:hypothetical protein EDD86DRAFT_21917 [Gorgonomyces haynaldii]|nr:hypothetical protein EDD86DRAFT_21917 [Gorgonomyces haynaldii]
MLLPLFAVLAECKKNSVRPNKATTAITGWTASGTGCTDGTVSAIFADDRLSFTLIFDNFIASSGPGVAQTEYRKDCVLQLRLKYDTKLQYAVTSIDYRGYANLPQGMKGRLVSRYNFPNADTKMETIQPFVGPYDNDYLFSTGIAAENRTYSDCKKNVHGRIVTTIALNGDMTKSALLGVDSQDGKLSQRFALDWQPC